LLGGGAFGRKHGIKNQTAAIGDLVAVGVRQLLDNGVRSEQATLTTDRGRALPGLFFIGGWSGIK
jgi:hypothetical protein